MLYVAMRIINEFELIIHKANIDQYISYLFFDQFIELVNYFSVLVFNQIN